MRLFRNWYIVRDTGRPRDYPPRAREEMVKSRLELADLRQYKFLVEWEAKAMEQFHP